MPPQHNTLINQQRGVPIRCTVLYWEKKMIADKCTPVLLRLFWGLAYLSKCLAMVDLSTVTLEDGSTTGSDISVLMMGSRNSSQASA